jgi:hypothetical protein
MSFNNGIYYNNVSEHAASDSVEVPAGTKAIKAVDASGAVVYTIGGVDIADYFIQGVTYPIGGDALTLIKATGSTPAAFVLYE